MTTPPARKNAADLSAKSLGVAALVATFVGLGSLAAFFSSGQKLAEGAAANIPDDCGAELCAGRKSGELVPLDGGVLRSIGGELRGVCECP